MSTINCDVENCEMNKNGICDSQSISVDANGKCTWVKEL